MSGERLLTLQQLASRLSISRQKVHQMVQDGVIPAIRVGKLWRFREQDVDEYMARNTVNREVAV